MKIGAAIIKVAPISLVLFIEIAFVPIGTEDKPLCPGRGSAHLLTDSGQRHARVSFDDQFVVYMRNDAAALECAHGVTENIPADALDDVLDKLRAI